MGKTLLQELKEYRYTPSRDSVDDHMADALRYAFISGAVEGRTKKRNWKHLIAWFVIGFSVSLLIIKYLLDTVGNLH